MSPFDRRAYRPARLRQSGYVLVLVLGALVVLALAAARFANRVDVQRKQTAALLDESRAELQLNSGLALMLYEMSTRRLTVSGFGTWPQPVWAADGRWYKVGDRLRVSIQDERGLISLNDTDTRPLRQLLLRAGVEAKRADRLIDVLADYVDTDGLRRLNGAEKADYEALGLPPPRNDFVRSIAELRQMPSWRDEGALLDKLEPSLSPRVSGLHNPNTSPRDALGALLPGASDQQLDLLMALRKVQPFLDGDSAVRATGLPLSSDQYMFHVGNELKLTLWIEGQPRAREYNLRLEPGGFKAPWLIVGVRTIRPPIITSVSSAPFELPIAPFSSSAAGQ